MILESLLLPLHHQNRQPPDDDKRLLTTIRTPRRMTSRNTWLASMASSTIGPLEAARTVIIMILLSNRPCTASST